MGEHLHNLKMKQFIVVLSAFCLVAVSGLPFSGSSSGDSDFNGSGSEYIPGSGDNRSGSEHFSGSGDSDFNGSGSGFFSGSDSGDNRSGSEHFSGSGDSDFNGSGSEYIP